MEEDLDGALKELLFHPYIARMAGLKETFSGKSLDSLLYKVRDHVSSEELKVFLRTLDGLEQWIKESPHHCVQGMSQESPHHCGQGMGDESSHRCVQERIEEG